VKKAQHGGRFDSVDIVPPSTLHSHLKPKLSPAAKASLRRSEQNVHDLTAMNVQDHAQRSMQREGSFILAQFSETRQEIAGRPIFDGNNSPSSASASMYAPYRRPHVNSPSSSPRARSGTTTIFGLQQPRRPTTAHPSREHQRQPFLNANLTDVAAAPSEPICTIAAPQTPDASQLQNAQHPLDAAPNPSAEQPSSQQPSHASPTNSSCSKRCSSPFCIVFHFNGFSANSAFLLRLMPRAARPLQGHPPRPARRGNRTN
jgi:hypothetical protein